MNPAPPVIISLIRPSGVRQCRPTRALHHSLEYFHSDQIVLTVILLPLMRSVNIRLRVDDAMN
jgi:hypothetical protein